MEVYKEYEYVKNGKTIRIKRKYEVKGTRAIKQSANTKLKEREQSSRRN